MALLDEKSRARLPDSAFAYVDSSGRRRLPINDQAHVRNALARFNQVAFEDEAARDRARTKLLKAAKKYGIVPVGFMTGQVIAARTGDVRTLPTGVVTFLLADIENSTGLVRRLGNGYPALLSDVRRLLRAAIRASRGREVDARADELFAVFVEARAALDAALSIQRNTLARPWPDGAVVRLRIGLHAGRPTLTDTGYVGLAVNTAARICSAGHGGQIVVSSDAREALEAALPAGVSFGELGLHRLQGLPAPVALFQVHVDDLPSAFPPLRTVSREPLAEQPARPRSARTRLRPKPGVPPG